MSYSQDSKLKLFLPRLEAQNYHWQPSILLSEDVYIHIYLFIKYTYLLAYAWCFDGLAEGNPNDSIS